MEYNEEKGYLILRIEDFPVHPLLCIDLLGYFGSVVKMVVGKNVNGQEIKCMHRGDDYHEFIFKW